MYTMLSGIFLGLHSSYAFTKKLILKKQDALQREDKGIRMDRTGMEDLELAVPPWCACVLSWVQMGVEQRSQMVMVGQEHQEYTYIQ